jgi:hypothetical protein
MRSGVGLTAVTLILHQLHSWRTLSNFCAGKNDVGISQEGKRILFPFVALNVSSLEEDTELLNFPCREAQLDIVTEEPGTAGGEGLAPSPRKRRRVDQVDSGLMLDVKSLESSVEKGFESISAALRPESQASDQHGNSGARLGAARKFEEVLEMFERATRKSDESTGVVKEYWDKLRFRLQGQLDDMS